MKQLLNLIDLLIWIFVLGVFVWNLLSSVPKVVWGIAIVLMLVSIAIKIKRGMTEGWRN